MKRTNIFATAAACALLVGVLAIPASAHHGGGHHARRAATTTTIYPACTVDECTLSYRHDHDGVTYCGHSYNDGHTWCADNAGYGRRGGCHRR